MNPWIAGRIVETMQQEARKSGEQARLGRHATSHHQADVSQTHEPRRTQVGLAVARLGLRIAGRHDELATTFRSSLAAECWTADGRRPQAARRVVATPKPDSSYRSNPWTTCGATSTSSR